MTTDRDFSPLVSPSLARPSTQVCGIVTPSGNRFFDNSMLDVYRVCPRKFYLRHVRNWEPSGVRVPLVFGSAIHGAMDYIWANAQNSAQTDAHLVDGAMAFGFFPVWDKHNMRERDEMDLYPRSPGRARQILSLYVQRYRDELERIEVLEIETPFIVPLSFDDEKVFYVGKWDKVYRSNAGIIILDHKTTSSMQSQWHNSFSPNGQMDGYLHAGMMTYGSEFYCVMVDGLLVQKTNVDVQRIPLQRQEAQLSEWSWAVTDLIDQIEYNEERLAAIRNVETGKRNEFLAAFPKCTTSCTQYYGICPYLDLCKFWNNPEQHDVPDFFVEQKWEPFQITEKLDGTFDIKLNEEAE